MSNLNDALKKWQALSRKARIAVISAVVFVLVVILYFMMVAPRLQQLSIANQAVERAKSGYAFIVKNAPALKNTGNVGGIVNLNVPVKDAVLQLAKDLNISNINVFEKNDKNIVAVNLKQALPYAKVTDLLTKLENGYGVTVKEIVLDKQGDGMVYVARLIVVRLEEGTE